MPKRPNTRYYSRSNRIEPRNVRARHRDVGVMEQIALITGSGYGQLIIVLKINNPRQFFTPVK